MHRGVGNNDEGTGEDSKPDDVRPEGADVKAESTQYRCTGDFDVKAVLVIDQGKVRDLINNESLESIMEDGQLAHD